jgi:hypothetical protein
VAFNSELGGEFATSKDVRVCERGVALSVYEGGAVLFLHMWMCTPQATSNESRLARKGVVEYACIVWSDLVVLASCRIWL